MSADPAWVPGFPAGLAVLVPKLVMLLQVFLKTAGFPKSDTRAIQKGTPCVFIKTAQNKKKKKEKETKNQAHHLHLLLRDLGLVSFSLFLFCLACLLFVCGLNTKQPNRLFAFSRKQQAHHLHLLVRDLLVRIIVFFVYSF